MGDYPVQENFRGKLSNREAKAIYLRYILGRRLQSFERISQRALGEIFGVSHSAVCKILDGDTYARVTEKYRGMADHELKSAYESGGFSEYF